MCAYLCNRTRNIQGKVNVLAEKAVFVKDIDKAKYQSAFDALSSELNAEISEEERLEKEADLKFYELALNN